MSMNAPHTCFDRIVPESVAPARAVSLRVATAHFQSVVKRHGPGMLHPDDPVHIARMALINIKKWEPGAELRCRFLDGSKKQKSNVQKKAETWMKYASIKIRFGTWADAQVRISFVADAGSWSAVGNDCLIQQYFPLHQPTMNFGWLRDNTSDQEYGRVVVHEFGHALGCIHEHQSPKAHLDWDKEAVYKSFSGPPNYWSKADIDSNILNHYGKKGLSATIFDPDSIMLYQFDGSLFKSGHGTKSNTVLSALDKQMIAGMYPKA